MTTAEKRSRPIWNWVRVAARQGRTQVGRVSIVRALALFWQLSMLAPSLLPPVPLL